MLQSVALSASLVGRTTPLNGSHVAYVLRLVVGLPPPLWACSALSVGLFLAGVGHFSTPSGSSSCVVCGAIIVILEVIVVGCSISVQQRKILVR